MSLPLTYLRDTLFTSPVSVAKNAAANSSAAGSLAGIATSLNTLGQNGSKQISSASKPSAKNYGTKSTPQQRAAQSSALDELRANVLAGNIPNSGSGIVPTTQQKINNFAGSSITATNTVAKGDAEKLDYSGVTYTKGEGNKDTGKKSTNTTKNNGTKKETKGDGPVAETLLPEIDVSGELNGGPDIPWDMLLGLIGGDGGFSYPGFEASDAYNQAMSYTNSLLSQLSSGRTSYSDQIDALIKEYQNREKFSYDMNTDPLFQQMLASSMNSGKMAMQDTIGQAAALTGGYGNTYGQAVGNAAYNQYITGAYENLPDYYNLALDAYNMEGEQMLNELDMLRDADEAEYGRLLNAYNANASNANAIYDREYSTYLNNKNMAYDQYWNEKNYNFDVVMGMLDQANIDREFDYNAAWNDKVFNYEAGQNALDREERAEEREYQRELDKKEWDYKVGKDAISALGGSTGYDALTNSDLQNIKNTWVANGGASGRGYEAVDAYLSITGKNNVDNEALMGILGNTYSPIGEYIDAVNSMSISPDRKEQVIQEIYDAYARKTAK